MKGNNVMNPDIEPTSLLHPQHVTDGRLGSFKKTLNPEQLAAVEKVMRQYANVLSPGLPAELGSLPRPKVRHNHRRQFGLWRQLVNSVLQTR